MAKAKKRVAARKKSSKRGKVNAKPARDAAGRRCRLTCFAKIIMERRKARLPSSE
jgi:hypothetical protein